MMDAHEVVQALTWKYGVRLKLNEEGTRVGLSRADRRRLPEELLRGIRANHDELLRSELFKDYGERFARWMHERHGADPESPPCRAAMAALGEGGTHERLNAAWIDGDLDGFKAALKDYFRPAVRAFKDAIVTQGTSTHSTKGAPRRGNRGLEAARGASTGRGGGEHSRRPL
ncbi:MAG: hypothetical protein AB1425_00935 [Actinomycetota bacterium]